MSEPANKPSRSAADAFFDFVGSVIPSCGTALRLVETGQERPLSIRERLVLKYNSPLCLHCNCNREKFDKERAVLKELDEQRRSTKG
ncbi:MAG: hypothetical protein AAGA96_07025 [Verrucomicrobiota bacterium]